MLTSLEQEARAQRGWANSIFLLDCAKQGGGLQAGARTGADFTETSSGLASSVWGSLSSFCVVASRGGEGVGLGAVWAPLPRS